MGMRVWIDQDLCTGDGLCEEIAPDLFQSHTDGLWYVKEANWKTIYGPDNTKEPIHQGAKGMAVIPEHLLNDAIEAAEECPGACIFIEVVEDD